MTKFKRVNQVKKIQQRFEKEEELFHRDDKSILWPVLKE
jgi:hypothetical protein